MALSLLQEREKIFIDNGNVENKKVFQLSQVGLDEMELNSLIGFHAFLGNDYASDSVNEARFELFINKYVNENKIIDLSTLPPCRATVLLHIKRANYIAKIWKSYAQDGYDNGDVAEHGWFNDGQIQWVVDIFPDDITDILFSHDVNDDEDMDAEESNLFDAYSSDESDID